MEQTDVQRMLDAVLVTVVEQRSVLLAALLAGIAVCWTVLWRWTRTVVTIAHEGGHALVAVLAGRGLTGIRLHPDTSGLTVSTGARRGPGLVLTFLGGYPAPSLIGLGGAALVAADRSGLMLWITVGALGVTLMWIRTVYGGVAVLATVGFVGVVAYAGSPGVQDGFAAALCWFLVFGGLRAVVELHRGRLGRGRGRGRGRGGRGRGGRSDADMLAALTPLPRGMWTGVFWLVAVGAAVAAAWVMIG